MIDTWVAVTAKQVSPSGDRPSTRSPVSRASAARDAGARPAYSLGRVSETHLTPQTYERLQAELDDLTSRGRIEIAHAIEAARALGDLSENADYHAAKDSQGKMETRIRQLQALLGSAVIVEGTNHEGIVSAGTVVTLRYEGDESVERFFVGSIEERRDDVSVVSPGSPLGQALMGHRPGETGEYEAPGGTLKVVIVELGG
jgi:transcription elongation factor GreA